MADPINEVPINIDADPRNRNWLRKDWLEKDDERRAKEAKKITRPSQSNKKAPGEGS